MKELSIEEKAKAYDHALEVVEKYKGANIMFTQDLKEEMFPKFTESEDDRIRKELLEHCKNQAKPYVQTGNECPQIQSWIAWLEKQGEKKCVWNDTRKTTAPSNKDILGWYRKEDGILEDSPKIVWFCCDDEAIKEAELNSFHLAYWTELPNEKFDKKYWFEKQGEHKDIDPDILIQQRVDALTDIVAEQKPADKVEPKFDDVEEVNFFDDFRKTDSEVEPKFKVGQWIIWQDKCYEVNYNGCGYELVDQNGLSTSLEYGTIDENAHLWTIQDAKDGDVLVGIDEDFTSAPWIGMFKCINKDYLERMFDSHCFLQADTHTFISPEIESHYENPCEGHSSSFTVPATKEQRDLLFAKMAEAGYQWDAEKKELKKIEQEPAENEELTEFDKAVSVSIGTWNPKTPEQIQSVKAISKKLLKLAKKQINDEQEPAWSEEDEMFVHGLIRGLTAKRDIHGHATFSSDAIDITDTIDWLRFLKNRYTWKPSNEQMKAFEHFVRSIGESGYASPYDNNTKLLYSLLSDLKKLKE